MLVLILTGTTAVMAFGELFNISNFYVVEFPTCFLNSVTPPFLDWDLRVISVHLILSVIEFHRVIRTECPWNILWSTEKLQFFGGWFHFKKQFVDVLLSGS